MRGSNDALPTATEGCSLGGRWVALALTLAASGCGPGSLDEQLREAMATAEVEPLDYRTSPDGRRVMLGRALFHDKLLSGNRDIACGTCHHPATRTSDGLSLSVGTKGTGLGPERAPGEGRGYVARHAPELFSRGVEGWHVLGWDGQIERNRWSLPSGVAMPSAIGEDLLAAHVMLKVTHRAAMRGIPGDFDVDGEENTLAYWSDDELPSMWNELIGRIVAIPAYVDLFAVAFPDVPTRDLGFEHAALALSAYVDDAFSLSESPWDLYVAGDDDALVEPAKRGALLFYGEARCSECHGGPLLTDQRFHNLCTPQLGVAEDRGRGARTGEAADAYAFRTPPLRNVSFTGPYMHAGSHATLEDALRHHLDACTSLRRYAGQGLPERFQALVLDDSALLTEIELAATPMAKVPLDLGSQEISDLMQFLEALSDPAVVSMGDLTPETVPSGLPVDR